ncbi:hypothetical protein PCAR4_110086 [Paraburkholderia caribensis]|nr:hypothetical protein PCAR4_110086 [Paraburkholderia caribensis]
MTATRETPWGSTLLPTCLSDRAGRGEAHQSMRAQARSRCRCSRRVAGGAAEHAVGPLCRRTGWLRAAGDGSREISRMKNNRDYNETRRMNGVGEVGARVRVDKLKP